MNKKVSIGWVIVAFIFFFPAFIYLIYKNMKVDDDFLIKDSPTNGYNTAVKVTGWIILVFNLLLLFFLIIGNSQMPTGDSSTVIFGIIMFGPFIALGLILILKEKKYKARNIRYKEYYELIKFKHITRLDQISSSVGREMKEVSDDLTNMIWYGFLKDYTINRNTNEVVLNSSFNQQVNINSTNVQQVGNTQRTTTVRRTSNVQSIDSVNIHIGNMPQVFEAFEQLQQINIVQQPNQTRQQVQQPQQPPQPPAPTTSTVRCPGCGANNLVTTGTVNVCEYCGANL